MFKQNDVLSNKVELLMKRAAPMVRGEIISHQTIAAVTGVLYRSESWQTVVNRFAKRMLRERGIQIWPEKGVGYKLLTMVEQMVSVVPRKRMARMRRQAKLAVDAIEAGDGQGLSAHERRVAAMSSHAFGQASGYIKRQMLRQSQVLRRQEGMPRPEPAGV